VTRELSAKLTEGEKMRLGKKQRCGKIVLFSPSVKTCGFATSLVRGRHLSCLKTKRLPCVRGAVSEAD